MKAGDNPREQQEAEPEYWIVRSPLLGTILLVFGLPGFLHLLFGEPIEPHDPVGIARQVLFLLIPIAGGLALFQSPGTAARKWLARGAGAAAFLTFLAAFITPFYRNSKRYGEVEEGIEAMMPQDRGLAATPTFSEDRRLVQIHLTLLHPTDPEKRQATIRLGDQGELLHLPVGWRGRIQESDERVKAYDAVIASLRRQLHSLVGKSEEAGLRVAGEITLPEDTPPELVPQGAIVQCLNALLLEGVSDVAYTGPTMKSEDLEEAPR